MRRVRESPTTEYRECQSANPDWREGEFCDDLAAQHNRLAHTYGLMAEWHRSRSREQTQRGRVLETPSSHANPNR